MSAADDKPDRAASRSGTAGDSLDRRDFLRRTGLALAAAAATGSLAYALRDKRGFAAGAATDAGRFRVADYSLADGRPKLAIVSGGDRATTVRRALESLGGVNRFVKKGDRVLLKVNAAFATPSMLAATTHPDLVREVARLCLAAGAASVLVTDNPINDPRSCFALSGIEAGAAAAGARVVLPETGSFAPVTLAGGRLIRDWPFLGGPLKGIDKLIGLAPVKDHHRAGASMTLKNWYGLLGGHRNVFHQDVHTLIAELGQLVKPTLVILDGTMTMMSNGPTGGSLADLKATQTMIVGTDPVAVDAVGITLLGRKNEDVPYLGLAAAAGVGTTDFESLKPIRVGA